MHFELMRRLPGWTDVVGIIGASATNLELAYLNQWADKLGLSELLDKAFTEAKNDEAGR
jgi:hypothetical protein